MPIGHKVQMLLMHSKMFVIMISCTKLFVFHCVFRSAVITSESQEKDKSPVEHLEESLPKAPLPAHLLPPQVWPQRDCLKEVMQ